MKRQEVFERLDPPRGGLAKLRARIEARPRGARLLVPVGVGLAIAATVALMVRRNGPDLVAGARAHGDGPEIELGLAPMPAEPFAVTEEQRTTTAVREVRTANPNVSFYWVSSVDWRE